MFPFTLALAIWTAHHPGTTSNFLATCTVTAIRSEMDPTPFIWTTHCRLEDMPTPGFRNRWRVLLYGTPPFEFSLGPTADYIRAETLPDGGVMMRSALWGEVRVTPIERVVREAMAEHPGHEIRPQRLQVQRSGNAIEVLFTEPLEDFDVATVTPSQGWQSDFMKSLRQLSRAH